MEQVRNDVLVSPKKRSTQCRYYPMIFVLRPSDVVDISQPHSLPDSPAFAIKSVKKMNVPYKFIVPGLDVYKSM